jgi:hypothetical protein
MSSERGLEEGGAGPGQATRGEGVAVRHGLAAGGRRRRGKEKKGRKEEKKKEKREEKKRKREIGREKK